MITLYRKYRPQNFNEVVGQNAIKMILQHEIESEKIAHAYLFCGPRAVGKTTLARVFAKAINCTNRKIGKFEPCDNCDACKEITEGRSLDIIEIDAASHTGVDNVRENVIASARVATSRLKYKVFIIDEVHMLSTAAFNALLKTLEEPPKNVVFILCTTETHKVPATIISRCQRFDFKRISLPEVVKKLTYIANKEEIKIDKEILEAIARQTDGHMRDAESLLGQLVNISGQEITREEADLVIPRSDLSEVITLIEFLSNKDAASGIRIINKLVDEGVDLKLFLNDLIEILRKLLIIKINPSLNEKLSLDLGESLELKINQASQNLNLTQVTTILEQFMKTVNELKNSFIAQLPIEIAIVRLCTNIATPVVNTSLSAATKNQVASENLPGTPVVSANSQTIKSTGPVSYEEILAKWNELLVRVKKYNHSLSFILRVCQPKSISGAELCLAFKYKFHKDRVSDPAIKSLIEKVLHETYNTNITIEAIIDENLEVPSDSVNQIQSIEPMGAEMLTDSNESVNSEVKPVDGQAQAGDSNMIDNLLKTFGGKVVG